MGRFSHLHSVNLRPLIRAAAPMLTAIASITLVAFALRIALSDSYRWSQYLFWLPSPVLLSLAAAAWIGASLVAAATRRSWKRAASPARIIVGLACALAALHIALADYRLTNRLFGPSPDEAPTPLRIIHWNASGVFRPEQFASPLLELDPDIVATVDTWGAHWPDFGQGPDAPAIIRRGNMTVLSRYPVKRYGSTTLDIPSAGPPSDDPDEQALRALRHIPLLRHAAAPDGLRPHHDPGRAMYVEIDTTIVLGRTTIIWLLDLPSDIRLHRREVTRAAMRAIRNWEGEEVVVEGAIATARDAGPGFPAPDIILGDLNIPRGSRSLREISLGYPHAHSQAGWGHSATYPRHRPMVHIDNMFVGPELRVVRYEIVDPGAGSHRMQVGEVVNRK